MKQTPFDSLYPLKSYVDLKNPEIRAKGNSGPLEIRGGTKFSNFDPKKTLNGALTPAEYESVLRKILKNFPMELESQKDSRHFATLAITF